MALSGKLIGYVEINKKGNVFYDLFGHNPNEIAVICPNKIHGCDLLDGEWGAAGTIVRWHYTHDGKKKMGRKVLIEDVNEENSMIVFKEIEGDQTDIYKSFKVTLQVDKKGDAAQVATVTVEFERYDESLPWPTSFLDFFCDLVKDIDVCPTN